MFVSQLFCQILLIWSSTNRRVAALDLANSIESRIGILDMPRFLSGHQPLSEVDDENWDVIEQAQACSELNLSFELQVGMPNRV